MERVMKILVLPLLACAALLAVQSEPTEKQIRGALESGAGLSSRPVLVENGDEVATLARTQIRSLRKVGCKTAAGVNAYTCSFVVGLGAGDQSAERRITARFLVGPGGLTFARQIYVDIAAPAYERVAGDTKAASL
jgi:hypothetical protein